VDPSQGSSGPYTLGNTSLTLTVNDSSGASASCSAKVTVVDQEAPVIGTVLALPNNLWPPNHKMVSISVDVSATDNCGVPECSITSVASNEPENALGDEDTAPDWEINGNLTVKLRAE